LEWPASDTEGMISKRVAGPGDRGPCPICGEDMAGKVYKERLPTVAANKLVLEVSRSRGRYWHMKNAHGIMEDYFLPSLPEGFGRPTTSRSS
jgi:hypothetical protein